MTTIGSQGIHGEGRTMEWSASSGSLGEAFAGIAALVLAILGLAAVLPEWMLPIGVLVIGAALVFEGLALTAQHYRVAGSVMEGGVVSESLGAEFLGGLTGIVLGILALLDVYPLMLSSAAIIVFGAALLLGNRGMQVMDVFGRGSVGGGIGAHLFVSIGVITLGILAVTGVATLTLCLVAVLGLGATLLLSGGALSARLWSTSTPHAAL